MKFALSEDQELLQTSTRDFLARECPIEKSRHVMEHEPQGFEPGQWQRLAELGYLGLILPGSIGGQELGPIELAIVLEEMGRVCLPGPYLDVLLAASVLAAAGKQETLLGEIAGGRQLVVVARHDAPFAGAGAAPARFESGRVRGRKFFVPFAARASALLVTTREGLCLVKGPVPATPLPTIDLAQRFGEVALDHPAILVGPPSVLERADLLGAVGASAMLLGIMSRCMEMTLAYLQTRQAFKKPIGAFQALQHRMADVLLRTESTRSAVYRAAWCLAQGDADAPLACAAAKAYAGDAARHVCGETIQMHGGIGFTWELDVHLYFKRAKTLEQHYGATDAQLEHALTAVGL